MSDIVETLRHIRSPFASLAAAELTSLRADLASAREREGALREALVRLEAMVRILPPDMDEPGSALAQARAALSAMREEP